MAANVLENSVNNAIVGVNPNHTWVSYVVRLRSFPYGAAGLWETWLGFGPEDAKVGQPIKADTKSGYDRCPVDGDAESSAAKAVQVTSTEGPLWAQPRDGHSLIPIRGLGQGRM